MWSEGNRALGSSPSPIASSGGMLATALGCRPPGLKKMKSIVAFFSPVAAPPGAPLLWEAGHSPVAITAEQCGPHSSAESAL
jgi:hypothetical protein